MANQIRRYLADDHARLGALLAGFTPLVGQLLILFGSLILVAISARLFHRHRSASLATMALGAILWAVGNGLWLMGYPLYRAVPWWVGFSAAGGMMVFSVVASLLAFLVDNLRAVRIGELAGREPLKGWGAQRFGC